MHIARKVKRWFQRVVLRRTWLSFVVMGLAFFAFSVGFAPQRIGWHVGKHIGNGMHRTVSHLVAHFLRNVRYIRAFVTIGWKNKRLAA